MTLESQGSVQCIPTTQQRAPTEKMRGGVNVWSLESKRDKSKKMKDLPLGFGYC